MKSLKKIMGIILAIVVVTANVPAKNVQGEDGSIKNNYLYYVENDEVVITQYIGNATEVEVPASIEGYPVTRLGRIFDGTDVTKVVLPNTLKEIGLFEFYNTKIKELTISESVKKIESTAFQMCSTLEIVNFNAVELESNFVQFFSNLKELNFGDKVKKLPLILMPEDNEIKTITIPEGVEELGDFSLSTMNNLETIYFNAKKITDRESGTFLHAKNLKTIIYGDKIETIDSNMSSLSSVEKVVLSNSVKTIGEGAFSHCVNLKEVILPESLKEIKKNAFAGCMNLKEITIPQNVEVIEDGAIAYSGLEKINYNAIDATKGLEESVKSGSLYSLKEVNFGNKVEKIAGNLLGGSRLSEVHIPKSMKVIGFSSFKSCWSLRYVSVPENVEEIQKEAFFNGINVIEIHNPTCAINSDEKTINSDAVIIGHINSTAQEYAIAHNRKFIPFESDRFIKKKVSLQIGEEKTFVDEVFKEFDSCKTTKDGVVSVNDAGVVTGVAEGKTNVICVNKDKDAVVVWEVEVFEKKADETTTTEQSEVTTKSNPQTTVKQNEQQTKDKTKLSGKSQLKKTSVCKIQAKKKSLKIKWKKVTGVQGYQLQYSSRRNFKKAKTITIKKNKTISTTIKKLKSKKKYYVRICTYKVVNKKTYYSSWSKSKMKKTK